MKNIGVYYFAILLPFPLLIWSAFFDPVIFSFLLISYYLYRGFTDGQRLIDLKLLESNKIYLAFIPFWTSRFFGKLYFG
ncbi:hypothetical protein SAMN03080598_00707 [Algoriphagus boritolerans DSM 17298 = JCM 18970]|uniref:Uncharacterized protein n=1 Tax=Algoriphagus boritolerans DSM 17298 = JCM 18970 TaxID=1120964 RepID=A0A1H5T5G5_9BACT|nr:hypothetical protein SAMN03080598_00707 [Algoriphagus boritolerans DSM 17298 = JCM 18970]